MTPPVIDPPPLPASATDATNIESCANIISTLASHITRTIGEGRSVTVLNKRIIQQAAEEIRRATLLLPKFCDAETENAPPPSVPQTHETLKAEIITCVREELIRHLAQFEKQQAPISYAQAAAPTSPPRTELIKLTKPPPSRPAIIVTSKDDAHSRQQVVESFKASVNFRTTTYAPVRIQGVSNNKLRVEFQNERQRDETLKLLSSAPSRVSAEPARELRPMVILKGISTDTPSDDLITIIKGQNEEIAALISHEEDLKIAFKRNNRNPNLYNAVLQAKPNIWRKMTEMGRVAIDYMRVHCEEFSPFTQCQKCYQFGHIKAKCTSTEEPCAYCSEPNHQAQACPLKEKKGAPKCVNCCNHNNKFKTSYDIKHKANSPNCPVIKSMQQRINNRINYGQD